MSETPSPPSSFSLPEECAFSMAEALLEAARQLFRRRKEAKHLNDDERQSLIDAETRLRQDADFYRVRGITWLGEQVNCDMDALNQHIACARQALEQVKSLKHCLDIAAALITFSTAVAAGPLPAIVKAGHALQRTVKTT